ncbi:MAG: dTDP-4-dehydrorhamnose reductase [Bacilli bacterium]|nr:dTDP-4-dehydrorhamnose reductase [Bacilli bacterium]
MNLDLKILVTGVKGQLGYDCVRELKERGYKNVLGIDKDELDITNEQAVHKFINDYKPDIVMHNAAWTQVDKAEQMEDLVYKVNALGTKYIAEASKEVNATMFYISTDYVFDGKGNQPFEVNSPKNGLSVYGKTKSQGEDFVTSTLSKYFIIRISWVFGINGNNFIKTMLKLAESHKELNIVCDQIGSPTYTYDLSKLMCDMMESNKYGIYHATNEGYCSWAEFAEYIFRVANKNVKVNHVTTSEYKKINPNQADRPLNSRMSKQSLLNSGFKLLPSWEDATNRYIKNELGVKYYG